MNDDSFASLTPDKVIDAVESLDYFSDGRLLALNSYENRVYQVGMEDDVPIIAKFYRPNRWSNEQIQEEHNFSYELAEQHLPVVPPIRKGGSSLFQFEGLRFSLFERRGGRAPELDNLDNLFGLAQVMGQMHCVGKAKPFEYREALTTQNFGYDAISTVTHSLLPDNLKDVYLSVTEHIMNIVEQRFSAVEDLTWLRCHGDCHVGNILWRDDKPNFVDFDDARMAPAIQDLWMFLSGDNMEQQKQMVEIIEAYEQFMPFDIRELSLIEPLRALRMIHYCAWLSKRWGDPAFPMHFPWFNTERYWGEHMLELKEQLSILQGPALTLPSWI